MVGIVGRMSAKQCKSCRRQLRGPENKAAGLCHLCISRRTTQRPSSTISDTLTQLVDTDWGATDLDMLEDEGVAVPDNSDWENDDGSLNHEAIAAEFDDRDPDRCEDCGLHRTTHPNMGCVGNYPDPRKERYMKRKEIEALYESPLGNSVNRLQDEGRNVYIAGFTNDHKYALVVDGDGDQVAVASLHTVNGIGRWECSKQHYENEIGLYSERFPVR